MSDTYSLPPSPGDLDDYWQAPSGIGPQAGEWRDKPHRLLYDLLLRINTAVELCDDTPAGSVMDAATVVEMLSEIRSVLTGDDTEDDQ